MAFAGADSRAKDIIDRANNLFETRSMWDNHYEEVARLILPSYSGSFSQSGEGVQAGEKRNQHQYDANGAIALERFASVLDSLLTPANQKYQILKASNPDLQKIREVRLYFEQARDVLFKYRYSSRANFRSQNAEQFTGLGAFGTGPMFVDKLQNSPGLRYAALSLGEIYFQQNHQGILDTAYRRFPWKAKQIADRWPDVQSTKIKQALEKNSQRDFWVIHAVAPRDDLDVTRLDHKSMPWASFYVLRDDPEILEEGGYNTWAFPTSRYRQAPREMYGRSPAMMVLPALKTLNTEKKTMLKQGHRITDPTVFTHDDGVVDGWNLAPGKINPGGVTADGKPLFATYPTGNLAAGEEMMQMELKTINDAFLVSLFDVLMETPTMTATEVLERVKEKGILLTPTVGRQQSEYISPLTERELDLMSQQGLLPPQPEVLREARGEYEIEWDSPISRAASVEEMTGVWRSVEQTLNVVNVTGDVSLLDHYNWEAIVPRNAEVQGVPLRLMNDPRVIEAIRKQRAEQQQTQQMIEAAPAAAGIMKAMPQGAATPA